MADASRVVLAAADGPWRVGLGRLVRVLHDGPVEVLPEPGGDSAEELVRYLQRHRRAIRVVVVQVGDVLAGAGTPAALTGLGLVRRIAEQGLSDFPVVLLAGEPLAAARAAGREWVPSGAFLAAAGYCWLTWPVRLADLAGVLGDTKS